MNNNTHEFDWDELKDVWMNSSQTKKIHIQMSQLFDELKGHVSTIEKDMIKKDLAILREEWKDFKGNISSFEKESINKDLAMIKKAINKFLSYFKGN